MVNINISKIARRPIKNSSEVEVELTWGRIKFLVSKIPFIKILLNMVILVTRKTRSQAVERELDWRKTKCQIIYLEQWRTRALNIFKILQCSAKKSMPKACLP